MEEEGEGWHIAFKVKFKWVVWRGLPRQGWSLSILQLTFICGVFIKKINSLLEEYFRLTR